MAVNWANLGELKRNATDFTEPWWLIGDAIEGVNTLKITAKGEWELPVAGAAITCGPNGAPGLPIIAESRLLATFAAGALVGKLGGSTAGVDLSAAAAAADGKASPSPIFPIGETCLRPLPEHDHGPLFISFNFTSRPIRIKTLEVILWGAMLA